MSHLPSATAVMPEPEPVGLYVNVIPLLLFIKDSPSAPITFSIDVDPSVETVLEAVPHPTNKTAAITAASVIQIIFFIIKLSFWFLFFVSYGFNNTNAL